MTLIEELDRAVVAMRGAVHEITTLVTPDLSADEFHSIATLLSQIDRLFHTRGLITTISGHLAEKHRSGNLVGSRTPEDYLINLYSVSRAEAHRMVNRGRDTYAPPKPAPITPTSDSVKNRRALKEAHRSLLDERTAQNRAAQHLVTNTPPEERLRILDYELRPLADHTHRQSIRAQALGQEPTLSTDDFRLYIRRLVNDANTDSADPSVGWKKRYLSLGRVDAHGGAQMHGYLPGPVLALLKDALAGANRPADTRDNRLNDVGADGPMSNATATIEGQTATTDTRTLAQRRLDGLAHLLENRARYTSQRRGGIGSLLVSVTAEELADVLDEDDPTRLQQLVLKRRPTNTGATVSLLELMEVGLARYDLVCVHDAVTGNPLECGRATRGATLIQKLALVASELVCSHPGCSTPAIDCDVHHITPWAKGGTTDIDNLTLLCRTHHMDNNDRQDPRIPRGWAARDPHTGRIGFQAPPPLGTTAENLPPVQINEGLAAQESAGWKIRHACKNRHGTPPEHPPCPTATPSRLGTGARSSAMTHAPTPIRKGTERRTTRRSQAQFASHT